MTPDELPADMEAAIAEVEALVLTYADNRQYDAFRALLKAYQEQRRALERLAGVEAVLGQGQGGIARDTDYARRVASDLRLLLSERAELLATVERMRGALEPFEALAEEFSVCGDGQPISIKAADGKSDLNVGHLRRAAEAAK